MVCAVKQASVPMEMTAPCATGAQRACSQEGRQAGSAGRAGGVRHELSECAVRKAGQCADEWENEGLPPRPKGHKSSNPRGPTCILSLCWTARVLFTEKNLQTGERDARPWSLSTSLYRSNSRSPLIHSKRAVPQVPHQLPSTLRATTPLHANTRSLTRVPTPSPCTKVENLALKHIHR